MSFTAIRSALAQGLVDANAIAEARIVSSNLPGKNDGAAWFRFIFTGADSVVSSLGLTGMDDVSGWVQVDLNYPLDSGDAACLTAATALKSYFTASRVLTYGGIRLNVRDTSLSAGRIVDGHYRRSFTIYWFTQIPRT